MRALVADDDRTTTAILAKALQQMGVEVTAVHDGDSAWKLLGSPQPPAIAIVDWMMPGLDGIELCRRVRSHPALSTMYLILLTSRAGRADLIAGLDAGADDYMVKPIDADELRARVQVGLRVTTLQTDLTERVAELRSARDHLARLASTDSLTELCSRRAWFELARAEFARARRYGRPLSVLTIDLDHFKAINDGFGHDTGDRVLQQFAGLLRSASRQSDVVGRLGGEEFAVLVSETPLASAERLAERIVRDCRDIEVTASSGPVKFTCSIGLTELGEADPVIENVLMRADAALYEAKHSGRNASRSAPYLRNL